MWKKILCFGILLKLAAGQSTNLTEDEIGNSLDWPGPDGLPEEAILGGKVTKLDDLAPIIFLRKSKAVLNCGSGVMEVELKFEEPFHGIVYANFDRASPCFSIGNGTQSARIDLPLKGCGTRQDPVRVFTNNIVVRFHPALELDGDEVITVVCRYPPPLAPPPPALPVPLQVPPPIPTTEQPLKAFQILLIICGILFLSLVLLGLAVSYYCLKNQRIQVVRKYPTKDEESLKGSGSSIGTLGFDTLKIPRVPGVLPTAAPSSTASETPHGSETLPSDYPSESPSTAHSEVEDIDSRRRSISSGGSYDNRAYIPDTQVLMQDQLIRREETDVLDTETTSITRHLRPPPPEPKFDVQMRVKKPPLPPPSPSISSDSEGSVMTQERNLLTIEERDEGMELLERLPNTFTYTPQIHSPPKSPPIYSEVIRRAHDKTVSMPSPTWRTEEEMNLCSEEHRTNELIEPPLVASRRPEITSHIVDDVFLHTITEKKTIEDIERHRRQTTEYHAKPQLPPAKWDVVIRNYPNPDVEPHSGDETATDWESYSENSSIYGIPVTTQPEFSSYARPEHLQRSHMEIGQQYRSTLDIPVPDPPPPNWNALIRVLEPSPEDVSGDNIAGTYRTEKTLTIEDMRKWRKIITTESTLRTLLTEATVKEDYERIRKDQRYERLFEPEKWDVIIRILAPPDRLFDQRTAGGSNRYRRKTEWDTRSSRRGSLPTLYEYDSDGSSLHNFNIESSVHPVIDPVMRSRRTSRSSLRSEMDVRSMSEVTVDFAKPDVPDNVSDGSSYYRPRRYYDEHSDDEDGGSLVRSLSQPSLARSASEFTENWGIRPRNWDLDSPEHSPRSSTRSGRNQYATTGSSSAYSVRQSLYQQKHSWNDGQNNNRDDYK